MNIERFKDLTDAYGANLRRWPASDRPFAESLLASDPAARQWLEQAADLDALMAASVVAAPSASLSARVLAAAPKARKRILAHLDKALLGLGAGWAAAACAGVVAGIGLTTYVTADERIDAVLYQSSLSGVDDMEELG